MHIFLLWQKYQYKQLYNMNIYLHHCNEITLDAKFYVYKDPIRTAQ